jgi:hypothetical protein
VTIAVLVLVAGAGCLAAAWLLAWRRAHDPYGRVLHCAECGARVPAGAGVCPRCRSPHLEGGARAIPGRPSSAPAARTDPHRPQPGWAEASVSDALRVADAVDPWAGPGDLVRLLRQVAAGLFVAGAALFAWFAFFAGTVPVPVIGVVAAGALAAGAVALWWGPGASA